MYYYNAKFERRAVNRLLDESAKDPKNANWDDDIHLQAPESKTSINDPKLPTIINEMIEPKSTKDLTKEYPTQQIQQNKLENLQFIDVANSGSIKIKIKKSEINKSINLDYLQSKQQSFNLIHYANILKQQTENNTLSGEILLKKQHTKSQYTKRSITEQNESTHQKILYDQVKSPNEFIKILRKSKGLRNRTQSDQIIQSIITTSQLKLSGIQLNKKCKKIKVDFFSKNNPLQHKLVHFQKNQDQLNSQQKGVKLTHKIERYKQKNKNFIIFIKRTESMLKRIHQKQHTKYLWQIIDNEMSHHVSRLNELNQQQQSMRTPKKTPSYKSKLKQVSHNQSNTQQLLRRLILE